MTINLRTLKTTEPGFEAELARLLDRTQAADPKIEGAVREIIAEVRARGDAALMDYTRRYDRYEVASAAALEIPRPRLAQAKSSVPKDRLAGAPRAARPTPGHPKRQK